MKAKELAASIPQYVKEKGGGKQAVFHVLHILMKDAAEVAKQRNIKAHSALASVYDEVVDKWVAFCRLVDREQIKDFGVENLEPEAVPVFMIALSGKEGGSLYALLAWYRHSKHKAIRECLGRRLKDELQKLSTGEYGLDPQTGTLRRISNV